MTKKRFADEDLRDAKVPQDEFNDSVKQMFPPPTKRMDIMDKNSVEHKILKLLYDERDEHGEDYCLQTPEIAERLSMSESDIQKPLRKLDQDYGYIEEYTTPYCARITEKGMAKIDPNSVSTEKEHSGNAYHITGDQNRILSGGSQDSSINIVLKDNKVEFENLNNTISNSNDIPDNVKTTLLELTNKMEKTAKTSGFKACFDEFILKSAVYMSIISPFVPFLTAQFV